VFTKIFFSVRSFYEISCLSELQLWRQRSLRCVIAEVRACLIASNGEEMSAHVAIFSVPIPALVHPTLSLVAALVRRGYRVTYVTSERFATEVALLGAEVVRCPRIDFPFKEGGDDMPIEHQYVRDPVTLASRTLPLASAFYEVNRPDLIVYDSMAFAGMVVADMGGARAIRMSNQFDYSKETINSALIPLEWKEVQLRLEKQANEFFASHGSTRRNVILENKEHTIYFYLKDLRLGESTGGPEIFHAARCVAERPNVRPWMSSARSNTPSALVASSTTYGQDPQYYKNCLVALSQLGWETVLAVGSNSNLGEFDSLPRYCQPVQNIPLAAIMPRVDLIICGAGMATAMEALYHGVPMLMLTSGRAELEAYGQQFHNHGMGIHVPKSSASAEHVAQCAVRMLDDSELRSKVKRAQDAVKKSAGAEDLVNWLEEHIRHARR
jgi:MGT family glycosyltransferase